MKSFKCERDCSLANCEQSDEIIAIDEVLLSTGDVVTDELRDRIGTLQRICLRASSQQQAVDELYT